MHTQQNKFHQEIQCFHRIPCPRNAARKGLSNCWSRQTGICRSGSKQLRLCAIQMKTYAGCIFEVGNQELVCREIGSSFRQKFTGVLWEWPNWLQPWSQSLTIRSLFCSQRRFTQIFISCNKMEHILLCRFTILRSIGTFVNNHAQE